MSADTIVESVLEDKFRDSYAQIARERRWSIIGGNIEAIALIALVILVVAALRFGFWGAGFSEFSAVQHNSSVDMLRNVPGPHLALMESDLSTKGYISLMDYKRYLQMAQEEKALREIRAEKAAAAAMITLDSGGSDAVAALEASTVEAVTKAAKAAGAREKTVVVSENTDSSAAE